ncbi:mechanosensitive ion channel family protein [Schleiferia thermophila]|jgi:small conductance mechanosensitive channel|uniref:mechanosensitive ion channel family protein n=1 Tax=Schleiferia thermophila TaxID=884107 RepID=UPI0004E60F57|nr:mechanosensitive ion channel domain-containing protein [Schleiferia thermophila]KFD38604.1 mechanosensitive ion channel protein [Schleiferia thermophila str. Yellowstone]
MKNNEFEILESNFNVDKYVDLAIQYGLMLIKAALILIIGLWLIKRMVRAIEKVFTKADVDETLRPFLLTIIDVLLKVVLIIAVVGFLGVQTSSFVAVLGAAGLAVGLALQGSLSNLAGGVIILLLKPFKVGEAIDFNGMAGTVKEIQIFHTIIFTFDNRRIIVPNAQLANSTITNITRNEIRRLDMEFSVAYGSDIDQVKAVITELISNDERFHKDPVPFIRLIKMADSSLNFVVRVWVNTSDYWPCYFDLNENTYKAFNQKGISIPFPQLDVHLKQA